MRLPNFVRDIGARLGLCDDSVDWTIRQLRAQPDPTTGLDYADLFVEVFNRYPDGFTVAQLAALMSEIAAEREKGGTP